MPDMDKAQHRFAIRLGASCALGVMAIGLAQAALAQSEGGATAVAQASSTDETSTSDIVVTGSHLGGVGYTSPSPVAVIGQQQMEKLAITNVADALNQLPSFRASTTPATNQYFTNTNIGANFADLRGLGSARTLVLVDGRRMVSANSAGNVDLNAIPSALIQRTEVVTGGASAAYGSDAVAGVLNIILDTKFTGLKAQIQSGISERGDAASYQGSLMGGTSFAGGRGHIVLAGEYEDDKGTGNCYERAWCYRNYNVLGNPGQGTNGLPAQINSGNQLSTLPWNGLIILGGGATGTTFNNNGTPRPYQYGQLPGALLMIGGEAGNPYGQQSWYMDYRLQVPVRRYSAFSHAEYDISPAVTVFAEGSFARVRGESLDYPYLEIYTPISVDNAYLPDATRAAALSTGTTTLFLNRSDNDLGDQVAVSVNKTYRGMVGAKGALGKGWSWDAYYQYGKNTGLLTIYNNGKVNEHNLALDAVVGPGGQIVCRSTLTDPGNGCAPLNLFGYDLSSPAAVAYVTGTSTQTRRLEQHVAAANLRGAPFATWAGDVNIAVGAEYRSENASGNADAISIAGGWQNNTAAPIAGRIRVYEFYGEAAVPLASDMPLANKLEVNGAIRRTHYNLSGGVTTWKVGGIYEPVPALRFRATKSRDIRAPNIDELFAPANTTQANIIDPRDNSQTLVTQILQGNRALKPETADTFTAGAVIRPTTFLRGFRLSADYYDIKIRDAIDTIDSQSLVNLCFDGNADACTAVTRNSAGALVQVIAGKRNLDTVRTNGVDIVADYTLPLSRLWPGSAATMNFGLTATYVAHLKITDFNGVVVDRAGQPGSPSAGPTFNGVPHWQLNGVTTFSTGDFALTLQGRYIEGGLYDARLIGPDQAGYNTSLPNSISNNHVAGRFYVNAGINYTIKTNGGRQFEIYGNINNLLDKDPPATLASTLVTYFDSLGRSYRVGIRVRL